jgi:hypothetical protein
MSDPTTLHSLPPEALTESAEVFTFTPAALEAAEAENSAAQKERAEAFSAPIREWNGQPLHGFSIGRENLWLDLRAAAGAPPWSELLRDEKSGLQPIFPDAVRILYILTRSIDEVKTARRDLLQFEQDAAAWADENISRARAVEAITAVLRIYNEAQVNEVELITEGSGSANRGK